MQRVWLRTPAFDVRLQVIALAGIAPVLAVYAWDAGRATTLLPLGTLFAIPFVHVFGSFVFAFSRERNRSPSPPGLLAVCWASWTVVAVLLAGVAPRGLATFALLYGGWHIFRQNFGFLRELAGRAGVGGDRTLRRLDLAACAAPAVALWLLVSARGPWRFLGADVYHVAVPAWLLALAFIAVPATVLLRRPLLHCSLAPATSLQVGSLHSPPGSRPNGTGRLRSLAWSPAALLLLAGNAAALLGPALILDDLVLIYTLAASYHGVQYLAYLAERERERERRPDGTARLASAILLSMLGWLAALAFLPLVLSPGQGEQAMILAWYAIVPFHYFVDGRIWRQAPYQRGGRRGG